MRAAVGGISIISGALYVSGLIERTPVVWAAGSILIGGGTALVIGFLTPFVSLVVALSILGIALSWFPALPFAMLGERLVALVIVATAMGIALLGPGAFSVDGYLFGRREIVIPPREPES